MDLESVGYERTTSVPLVHSAEELDHLERNTKKIKSNNLNPLNGSIVPETQNPSDIEMETSQPENPKSEEKPNPLNNRRSFKTALVHATLEKLESPPKRTTRRRLSISSSQFDKMEEQDRTNVDPTPLFSAPPPSGNTVTIPTVSIIYEFLSRNLHSASGGIENVEFLAQDLYNDKRDRKNMSYQYFGDVVVFDTTYYTNKYYLIFAPILGVNHHRQTTLLGCAFLSDEKTDSFVWLFNEWLKAMPGGPPKMIITDQDPAMTKAIASALPNTFHRYCIWHIVSKYSEKMGVLSYKEHYDKLKNCIWNSGTPGEFDARWAIIVENSKLSSNKWLQNMYKIRDRWVPAYTNNMFSAHMTSSQRAKIFRGQWKRK
ncbi:protein FAR-RED IMPAIRED RESPONSE 1-like [Rhododendron vialii]|uniref:protein FAR-RED IMPAIRED RESPONSE 1-like n=1 Tax=Rhododendron vialii TaxID=182163 RepID=UPI0026600637|nr:protein FAR-RED IMPAIRED RESPONSE 1-like [Rhododendron vialii]